MSCLVAASQAIRFGEQGDASVLLSLYAVRRNTGHLDHRDDRIFESLIFAFECCFGCPYQGTQLDADAITAAAGIEFSCSGS